MVGWAGQRSSRMAGTTMKSPWVAGAFARTASTGQRGLHDVVAQDVLELDGLRRRRDVVGRQLGQDRVLVEDVIELGLQAGQLGFRQPEPREVRHVLDVRAGQVGHVPDDSRRARYDRSMQLPAIRPMTRADVDPVAKALLLENWGDRRLNLEFVTRYEAARPFVAVADGEIVGPSVASIHGTVAWIGTVWVRSDRRRRGLGRELTRITIDAAESAGARTLLLVATDAGRPLYEGLGFEVQTWYLILEAPGLDGEAVDPAVRPFRTSDLAAIAALDAAATGEDRGQVLATFATPDTARVFERADRSVGGFVVRAPWGGAATIAPRFEDADAILRGRRFASGSAKHVRAGLLIENEAGLARLSAAGWFEAWRAPRLIRGDALQWEPGSIWGQFNFAMG